MSNLNEKNRSILESTFMTIEALVVFLIGRSYRNKTHTEFTL